MRRPLFVAIVAVAAAVALAVVGLGDRSRPSEPDQGTASSPTTGAAIESAAEDASSTTTRPADVTGSFNLDAVRQLPPAAGVPTTAAGQLRPVALRLDDIGIDRSSVIAVGVEANGELSVPGASEVGWYRFGSSPGEAGSSVLAAHIAYDGDDGVFRHLASVRQGAEVELELSDGTTVRYRIDDVVQYDKTELPFEQIFTEQGDDRLVLITCGGDFNPDLRSYDDNVVAYASRL